MCSPVSTAATTELDLKSIAMSVINFFMWNGIKMDLGYHRYSIVHSKAPPWE